MPSGRDVGRAMLAERPDPYVVPFHTQWLELPPNLKVYSEEAIDFVTRSLRGEFAAPRIGRLSPSMLGRCPRESLFTYAGVGKLGEDPDSQDLMGLGTWGHLRWQAEGLSYPVAESYMVKCEWFVHDPAIRLGGSIDAQLRDGSGFDLKTAFFTVMSKVIEQGAPKWEHRKQRAGYYMLTGIEWWSWVYEERGTGDYYEFRKDASKDTQALEGAEEELEMLNSHIDNDTLPTMKEAGREDCEMRMGRVYKSCPYRKICPKLNSVTEAQKAGEKERAKEAA